MNQQRLKELENYLIIPPIDYEFKQPTAPVTPVTEAPFHPNKKQRTV
jgi:hypothetical protein